MGCSSFVARSNRAARTASTFGWDDGDAGDQYNPAQLGIDDTHGRCGRLIVVERPDLRAARWNSPIPFTACVRSCWA
jgi:hypothetical protein